MRFIKVVSLSVLFMGLVPQTEAFAITSLKKIDVLPQNQVKVQFDNKIQKGQVKVEFINDIIQVSLTDVSVYPAKIMSLSDTYLSKVFAYQYSPKLVRLRLTVKGKAVDFQDKFNLQNDGKEITLTVGPVPKYNQTQVVQNHAQGAKQSAQLKAPQLQDSQPLSSGVSESIPKVEPLREGEDVKNEQISEKQLLDHVIQSHAAPEKPVVEKSPKSFSKPLAGGKPLPGFGKMLGSLSGVLLLLGAVLFIAKKYVKKGGMGKLASLVKKDKSIEVVASHYLGPKKSISVVRVMGKTLVLGVTEDSINLISQLQQDEFDLEDFTEPMASAGPKSIFGGAKKMPAPKSNTVSQQKVASDYAGTGARAAGNPVFSDILGKEASRPDVDIRAQIKSKVEGLKPL